MSTRLRRFHPAWPQAVAAVAAFHFVMAVLLAAVPQWHHSLHADADHEDHECVVTHLIAGDLGAGGSALAVGVETPPPAHSSIALSEYHPVWVEPLFLNNGLLEHGPPDRS